MNCTIFDTAEDGIAGEMALLNAGRAGVLVWQAREPSMVVPGHWRNRLTENGVPEAAAAAGWQIRYRRSGGGAVPQGPAVLNLAMVTAGNSAGTIESGYRLICDTIAEACSRYDVPVETGARDGVFCDGRWNVLAGGRKLAGTAQRRQGLGDRRAVLLHAAILMAVPDAAVWPVLQAAQACVQGDAAAPLCAENHASVQDLIPLTPDTNAFAGALVRAATDRLHAQANRMEKAA